MRSTSGRRLERPGGLAVPKGARTAAILVLVLAAVGCAASSISGGSATPPVGGSAAEPAHPADVEFIRAMLRHHAQAIEMTRLVGDRTTSEDIRLLAQRIDISQRDEIAMMQQWLVSVGQTANGGHDHTEPMPGMLTARQMETLGMTSGEEFDRLFLESMIQHHQGAIEMVAGLFTTPGAAQDADIYQIAAHVDSDQRVEIGRMSRMLAASR
jgi:uncharacterized protein (DUF305 family)